MKKAIVLFAAASSVLYGTVYGKGMLCLTFDDRNFNSWERCIPLFEKYGALLVQA